jgi:hypothetical protein
VQAFVVFVPPEAAGVPAAPLVPPAAATVVLATDVDPTVSGATVTWEGDQSCRATQWSIGAPPPIALT